MYIDFLKLAADHRLPIMAEGHRHCRPGWVQLCCPHCGDADFHLGFALSSGALHCYRCPGDGLHRFDETLAKLLGASLQQAHHIMGQYRGVSRVNGHVEQAPSRVDRVHLPPCEPLGLWHREYLEGRGFHPDTLDACWNLRGTGPVGAWKFRIIIPIEQNRQLVAWQGRDITGRSPTRYKSSTDAESVMPIKDCLYGEDLVPAGHTVIVVEGVPGVWCIGPGAVCTFGVSFTTRQVLRLTRWRRRFILFDPDEAGRAGASALAAALAAFDGETTVLEIPSGDPGELAAGDVGELRRMVGFSV